MKEPFLKMDGSKNGLFCLWASFLILSLSLTPTGIAFASDGATEALQMRHQAELAIAAERIAGHAKLAQAMEQALPGLLQEYLTTRDGTIALDTVDAAFVEDRFKIARAMEEPGVALALDVYAGPGTGYEDNLRNAISNLADFQPKDVERFGDRTSGRDPSDRVSDKALDSIEKHMERQLEKIVAEHLDKAEASLDGRFSAKHEAKLDAIMERVAERKEFRAEITAAKEALKEAREALQDAATEEAVEEAKEAVQEAKEAVQEAKEAVKEAREEAVKEEKPLSRAEAGEKMKVEQEVQRQADLARAAERAEAGEKLQAEREAADVAAKAAAAERKAAGEKLKAEEEAKEAAKPKR